MARKLSDEEHANLDYIRETLCSVLEPSQKNKAASVASALVRRRAYVINEEQLDSILRRCGKDTAAVGEALSTEILEPVDGQKGVYTLRVPYPQNVEAQEASSGSAGAEMAEPEVQEDVAEVNEGQVDAAQDDPSADVPAEASPEEAVPTAAEKPAPPKPVRKRRARKKVAEAQAAAAVPASDDAPAAADAAPVDDSTTEHPAPAEAPEPVEKSGFGEPADKPAAVVNAAPAEKPGRSSAPRTQRGRLRRMGKGSPSRPMQLSEVPYVRRGGPAETEVRAKILELDQRFWMNGWLLSHPGAYTLFERQLTAINDALVNGALPGDITRRQLAYQMGGDEKFFEYGSDGHKLLRAMGMEDVIRHRPMPKPDLLYHAPRRRKHMRVLVTENLDPWLDVHDLMYEEGRTTILGERIHAVVLGGGTPILEHNRLALLLDTLGADSVEVLYWGDVDRAGIDIMVRLRDVLGEHYPFAPFTPAYQLMIDKAQERYPDPADNEQTCQVNLGMPDMSLMCEGLTEEAAAYARSVVEGCRLIPQEILTRRDL